MSAMKFKTYTNAKYSVARVDGRWLVWTDTDAECVADWQGKASSTLTGSSVTSGFITKLEREALARLPLAYWKT